MNLSEAQLVLGEVARETLPGVFHAYSWGIKVGEDIFDALGVVSEASGNGKARLCLHPSPEETEQQMIVALSKACSDQIHFHPEKSETVIWVKGEAEHRKFDARGTLTESTLLGPSGHRYVHTPPRIPHHTVVKSEIVIFFEISKGPFGPNSTIPADFSSPILGN